MARSTPIKSRTDYRGTTLTGWCMDNHHLGCPFIINSQAGVYHCSCGCHDPLELQAMKGVRGGL